MSTTMEQVVSHLRQELFNLRAQVAAQSGLSVILSQRRGFSAVVEEDGGIFFAGVIKESEMMLEWAAEQTTEITTELIDREFLLTATNQERGVQNLECVLQQNAYSACGSHEL